MKNTLALVSGLTMLALTGCSSQQDYQTASGSYDYLEASQRASVKIPEDLDAPEFSSQYDLPTLGKNADESLVGKSLTIQSPALVLPLVSGSHVEEGTQSATIWFDQVDDSQPLSVAIWNTLLSFLEENNIGVESFDKEKGQLITNWVVEEETEESVWYQWTEAQSKEIAKRFVFDMSVKPHGRTASLSATLQDYKSSTSDGEIQKLANLNDLAERREEVNILNEVISHYEYQIQLDQSKRIAEIRKGLKLDLGFDSEGAAAYVVNAQYDIAWPRLLLVLRKMGFDVKDLDKSTGLLFVSYNGDDTGWWSNLFSSGQSILEKGDYRLKVTASGENQSTITFMNDESEPFEPNQVADMYDQFARVMSEDDLDI
ncbi:outer membrane protein assembly factor BamC [Aestuariibacter sp. A3R04]|uniref:outer membrane protein assembly factor BamC n=1 Tax=Aestuariibacter sp. A3R04 TaxID=2841571 RepID=UPI001C097CFA|nr:outer membrane protein assembly factor BamC [Aestuariibacter sp. A3R04]MBU3022802.1 outer membrane protein assembly factor BamC [Aestuariibacter sp. A3R04]